MDAADLRVFVTGTTAALAEGVLWHRLDGAFVCGPVDHPDLAAEALFDEELAVATAPAVRSLDELPQRGAVKIIVFRAGCSYRQGLEAVLAGRGILAPQPLSPPRRTNPRSCRRRKAGRRQRRTVRHRSKRSG